MHAILLLAAASLAQDAPAGEGPTDGIPAEEIPTEAPVLSPPVVVAPPPALRPVPEVAASLGVAVPAGDLQPSGWLRLEGSVALPALGGRLRPFVSLAWMAPATSGTGVDPSMPDPEGDWSWKVRLHELTLAPGLALRALPHTAPISPEISLAPALLLVGTRSTATSDGQDLGRATSWTLRPAWLAGIDLHARVGPGRIRVGASFSGGVLDDVATGRASARSEALSLGYQLPLGPREAP
jgi:hypothetical protein